MTTDPIISELKKIDRRLSQPAVDLGLALFEVFPDALIICDPVGIIKYANTTAGVLFGYTNGEMLDIEVEQLLLGEDRERHRQLRIEYTEEPHVVDSRTVNAMMKDGTAIKVQIGVRPVTIRDVPYFVATVRSKPG